MKKMVVNCVTGEAVAQDMTDEEIADLEASRLKITVTQAGEDLAARVAALEAAVAALQ